MLKKLFLILAISCICTSATFAADGFPIRSNEGIKLQPGVQEPGWKVALYRANNNKSRPAYRNRYFPQVTGREYYDCTYYKYCDCSNIMFSRCWQCRDYVYHSVLKD